MKKKYLITMLLIALIILLISCEVRTNMNSKKFEDIDNKLADLCIDNLCSKIKKKDRIAVKKIFSKKACFNAEDIEIQIEELFKFINGEILSWKREEPPIVEDYTDAGKEVKLEMFWFSLKTTEEVYEVFLSYYPVEDNNCDNKGIYSFLIIKECDKNTLEGSIDEWSTNPGIKICL